MSTDATAVCDKCKTFMHLGQDMGGVTSFGYGSKDEKAVLQVLSLCLIMSGIEALESF